MVDPVRLDPFQNIVNVSWRGDEYLVSIAASWVDTSLGNEAFLAVSGPGVLLDSFRTGNGATDTYSFKGEGVFEWVCSAWLEGPSAHIPPSVFAVAMERDAAQSKEQGEDVFVPFDSDSANVDNHQQFTVRVDTVAKTVQIIV